MTFYLPMRRFLQYLANICIFFETLDEDQIGRIGDHRNPPTCQENHPALLAGNQL